MLAHDKRAWLNLEKLVDRRLTGRSSHLELDYENELGNTLHHSKHLRHPCSGETPFQVCGWLDSSCGRNYSTAFEQFWLILGCWC